MFSLLAALNPQFLVDLNKFHDKLCSGFASPLALSGCGLLIRIEIPNFQTQYVAISADPVDRFLVVNRS